MKKMIRISQECPSNDKCPSNLPNDKSNTFEENFKIYLRVKPLLTNDEQKQSVKIINKKKVQLTSPYYSSQPQKIYSYEEVFTGETPNSQVFLKTMIVPIVNVLSGYNSTVFIYGMTGAGKTYTMFGESGFEEGIVSMTLDYMFNEIQSKKQVKTQVYLSFFQIYNENIRDLLDQNSINLTIMEDPIRGVFINDLKQIAVERQIQAKQIIHQGLERRSMNATKSNELSSRSHAILQFSIKRYIPTNNDQISVLESKFFMIDLAGNEKTCNNQAKRFIEGVNINKSLLTLGKCINILAEQKKNSFVPFRDSKLTRILKQSLGGNSKTVMIACISSQRKFYEETLNTLKYSTIAKRIKNKGIKNNIKLISKNDLPDQKQFVNNVDGQINNEKNKIMKVLAQLIKHIQEKITIEKILEDLQTAKIQNQKNIKQNISIEQSKKYLEQINMVQNKINNQYLNVMHEIDLNYSFIVDQFTINKNQFEHQRNQIVKLNQIIVEQQNRIKQYEEILNNTYRKQPTREQLQPKNTNISIYKHQKNDEQITNRSGVKKRHQLRIQCQGIEESFRSNIQQSLRNTYQPQITINLNQSKNESKGNKQQFIKKLKQTQKRVKCGNKQNLSQLIQEQQSYQYDLGSVEQSMLRKIRFFQKERSIMNKSYSLGGSNIRRATSIKKINNKI